MKSKLTIGDLPNDTLLQYVKIRLPKSVYEQSSLPMYNIKSRDVYLQGWTMGDYFVKTDKNSTNIYPMFWNAVPLNIKEWEVIES